MDYRQIHVFEGYDDLDPKNIYGILKTLPRFEKFYNELLLEAIAKKLSIMIFDHMNLGCPGELTHVDIDTVVKWFQSDLKGCMKE